MKKPSIEWDSKKKGYVIEHEFETNEELIDFIVNNHDAMFKDAKLGCYRVRGGLKG